MREFLGIKCGEKWDLNFFDINATNEISRGVKDESKEEIKKIVRIFLDLDTSYPEWILKKVIPA